MALQPESLTELEADELAVKVRHLAAIVRQIEDEKHKAEMERIKNQRS